MVKNIRRESLVSKSQTTEERLLQKRKFYIRFLVIFTVLMLLAFNLGSWLLFNRMDNYLEQELEKRLVAVASLTAQKIETDYIDEIISPDEGGIGKQLIQQQLRDMLYDYDFESAFVIDRDYTVLFDGGNRFPRGQKRTYIKQDSTALEQAWAGNISPSPIHILDGNKFKSVYAPIKDDLFEEVQALLVLGASADFFELLKLFQQGLIFGGLVSFGLIIVFSFFISWMITLLMRTHESLQQSEKLASMGRMAASMAHEIRNPLGIIKGTADVLKEKYAAKDQPDELFDYISTEVQRLNYLIANFLSFAREPKLNLKSANIKTIIEKAVAAIEREEHDFKIDIITNIKNEIPLFKFDENTIQQVLFNLMINAHQAFERDGKIEININLISLKNKKYVEITVADNGPGIEGDTTKIFEPFFTTKSTGSGLGLAICKQIINKHGGWIHVISNIGKGTTFTIFLPL
jgi:signal transduction histidine kinase